jgi:hypothetical protein
VPHALPISSTGNLPFLITTSEEYKLWSSHLLSLYLSSENESFKECSEDSSLTDATASSTEISIDSLCLGKISRLIWNQEVYYVCKILSTFKQLLHSQRNVSFILAHRS